MSMDRREFCGASLAAPAALLFERSGESSQRGEPSVASGLPLEALRDRYRRYLFDDFLPFMDRSVIDHEHGGFMCHADYTGARESETKDCWFEGRGTWVYAFLYNHLAKEERYLDVARRSAAFIMKARPADGGPWPRQFTRDGRPLTPPDTAIYGALFVAEGLQELAYATRDRQHRALAKQLILDCVERYDRVDYEPVIGQTYLGPGARPFPGARIQGVWMVLIRVVTQMLEREADGQLQALADRCVHAVVQRHYHPVFQLNNELLSHDLSRPDNEYAQLVYAGHSIETLWMLLQEALRRKDAALFNLLADRFRRHVDVAWDRVYGGVLRNLMHVDQNTWTLDKVLWAQEEVLIGSLLVYEHTGAAWAREMFERTLAYVEATYPLAKRGSPVWMYAGNRRVDFEEFLSRPKRIENYHHPRHLMLNLLALERMIAKGGAPSKRSGGSG
jgi:mannose/cellobiose epimerase-like protein (N-acyl-D-glucosamine 2-epimerase family)